MRNTDIHTLDKHDIKYFMSLLSHKDHVKKAWKPS